MGSPSVDNKYLTLAQKWLDGTISPEEEKEFAEWYNSNQDNPVYIPPSLAANEAALAQKIFEQIEQKKRRRVVPLYQSPFFRVAAAVLVIVFGAFIYWMANNRQTEQPIAATKNESQVADLKPGGNKAILQLANGSTIVLDSANNGNIATQGSTKIIKLNNGELAYESSNKERTVSYNTLSTPKGGQYQIALVDGTNVWLNATSSITFPTAFIGNERVVTITGEAYFEVAKNGAKPFKVKVKNNEITVLGTHFNVNAYDDEPSINTTLLEGSVKVDANGKSALLVPGQQSQVGISSLSVSHAVDLKETMAWKNGLFIFTDANVESIMRQMARWYDVEVTYNGKIDKHFNGTIMRNVDASTVLKMLELTNAVHFQVNGKKILVTP